MAIYGTRSRGSKVPASVEERVLLRTVPTCLHWINCMKIQESNAGDLRQPPSISTVRTTPGKLPRGHPHASPMLCQVTPLNGGHSLRSTSLSTVTGHPPLRRAGPPSRSSPSPETAYLLFQLYWATPPGSLQIRRLRTPIEPISVSRGRLSRVGLSKDGTFL